MSDLNRFEKAANQLSQAWDMATTGKYSTWRNPVSLPDRLSHIGHRLTDALHCIFTGQTRVEAMYESMADDLDAIAEEIEHRKQDKEKPLHHKRDGLNGP